MASTKFLATVLVIMLSVHSETASAQLRITAKTLPYPGDNRPNTFFATSDQIGSSLLGRGVPSVLWLVVKSSDVTAACKHIVSTGRLSISIIVTDDQDSSTESLDIQIKATGGCEAAPDESGTEMVWVDNLGRNAALVCPPNAGSIGCGVFARGDAITAFYNQHRGPRRRSLLARPQRKELLECEIDAIAIGFWIGYWASLRNIAACAILPPPASATCAFVTALGGAVVGGFIVGCVGNTAGRNCFPGDATLQLAGGFSKSMGELELGDRVAVLRPDGSFGYEEVYAFGHRDAMAASRFYRISVSRSEGLETSVELSGRHFAPISSTGVGGQKMVYRRAQDIQTGDMMWALNENAIALYNVTGISVIAKKGLYNPFTMTGTIVVNGVVSSVHSDWFLDEVFDKLGVTHLLPSAYQVALAPPRMLYKVMGKELYTIAYDWLDQHVNLVQHISDYSGIGASLTAAGVAVGTPSLYYLRNLHFKSSLGLRP